MENFKFICIECPIGCNLTVEKNGEELTVSGNTCKRGEMYAKLEVTSPKRVITTVMRTEDEKIIAVKTDKPVLKTKMFEYVDKIKSARAKSGAKIGDVLIENIEEGANVIATSNPY